MKATTRHSPPVPATLDGLVAIQAEGDYVKIHAGRAWHLLRETMKHLETQFDPARFVRIHRSTIVNVERIKELQPWFRGDYVIVLKDNRKLALSRTYRARLNL